MAGATVFYTGTGEAATLQNTFTVGGTPTDPTTVTLVVTDPGGTITNYTYPAGPNLLTRVSAGLYSEAVPLNTIDGLWNYVWFATGPGADVEVGNWRVFPAATWQWYTSLEEVKSRLNITDATDDYEVQLATATAAKWIEGRCGRHFYQMTDTRTYVPESIWESHVDDLVSVTAFFTDPNGDGSFPLSWTQNVDYELALGYGRYNPKASGEPRPYKSVYVIGGGNKFFPFVWPLYRADRIKIQGTFGWPAVPYAVSHATLILAAELFKLKDAPFGVAGTPELGVTQVRALPQIEDLLTPYIDETRKVGV